MATYNTESQVERGDDATQLNTGLSTQIIIKVNGKAVGALQTLTVSQTRPLARIKEIGTDGVIEIIPNDATTFEITAGRIVFDQLRLPEAFSRGFRFINAQRLPFDIEVIDISGASLPTAGAAAGDTVLAGDYVTMVYKNCWFNRYETPYSADNYLITETATIYCETAYVDYGANSPYGFRGLEPESDGAGIESSVNRAGGRRGSLDAAGILNSVYPTT